MQIVSMASVLVEKRETELNNVWSAALTGQKTFLFPVESRANHSIDEDFLNAT